MLLILAAGNLANLVNLHVADVGKTGELVFGSRFVLLFCCHTRGWERPSTSEGSLSVLV